MQHDKRYDVILFDLDDTLFDFQHAQHESLKVIHQHFYATVPFSDFSQYYCSINTKLWQRVGHATDPLLPRDIAALRFSMLNQKLKIVKDAEATAKAYEAALVDNSRWLSGAKETISLLHQQGYILGVITNGLAWDKRQKYQKFELHQWFDAYIVSDEFGISKPDKRIFDKAILDVVSTGRIQHEQIKSVLMVGDSLASDGLGAKNTDMHFCWVTPGNTKMQPKDMPVHYQVKSVEELPAIFGLEQSVDGN